MGWRGEMRMAVCLVRIRVTAELLKPDPLPVHFTVFTTTRMERAAPPIRTRWAIGQENLATDRLREDFPNVRVEISSELIEHCHGSLTVDERREIVC